VSVGVHVTPSQFEEDSGEFVEKRVRGA